MLYNSNELSNAHILSQSDGERTFKALAVATDISPPASPCGSCRQFVREFCALEMPIFMYDVKGDYVVMTLGEVRVTLSDLQVLGLW